MLDWLASLRRRYSLPVGAANAAWRPPALEYSATCSAPAFEGSGQVVVVADEYHHGRLDWHSFDLARQSETLAKPQGTVTAAVQSLTTQFIPGSARCAGAPKARWFEFEDERTDFGAISADTTDTGRLLFIEFGLVFSNDWYLFHHDTPVGSIARIDALAVTDSFGDRLWVEPAGANSQSQWQKWSMYRLARRGGGEAAGLNAVFIPDTAADPLESEPQERVLLFRDEIANMVWGVERTITGPTGAAMDGRQAASERTRHYQRLAGAPPPPPPVAQGAAVSYKVMTEGVPANWIPFIPVHMPGGDNREIQLQRAALMRTDADGNLQRIEPHTRILRHNLPQSYFIHEEEVPRAGAEIVLTYQRARTPDGAVVVWLGRRKRRGYGEGASGLAFDQIT